MRMNKNMLIITGILLAGVLHAEVLFSADGFEDPPYTNGTSVTNYDPPGSLAWVQWDPVGGNNGNPAYSEIQNGTVSNGTQALGIRDTNNRVIARLVNVNATNELTSWRAAYKSEATSDFGAAFIVFRTDAGNKSFGLNTIAGLAQWYDVSDSSKRVQTTWGAWDDIDVRIDLSADTYEFHHNGELAFSGTLGFNATQINSWEIDVTANDAATPTYAFYVDDLEIGTYVPPPPNLVLFSADGFENPPYSLGPVTDYNPPGDPIWVQWDPDGGNNGNTDYTVVQSSSVYTGAQALAIADTTNRVISRINGLNITNSLTYYEAWVKSEATNDFGLARITLRFDSGTKLFDYNPLDGLARWFDSGDPANRSLETPFGTWHKVRIEADLVNHTYRFLVNGTEEFTGDLPVTATQVNSWEMDVYSNDSGRSPSGQYVFYIDDLEIGIAEEEAAGYEGWIAKYPGVGSSTNLTDNPDGDALNNLAEWALGGRPDVAGDVGELPVNRMVEDGDLWLEYVHVQRSDAAALGLSYYLELAQDLAVPSWTNDGYTVVSTNVTGGEFDVVTNRVPTDVEQAQFVRLTIESSQ